MLPPDRMIAFFFSLCFSLFLWSIRAGTAGPKTPVLILDIDGTVYDDDCNIEQQIRQNYLTWAWDSFQIGQEKCFEMRKTYGATVAGLAVLFGQNAYPAYYNNVYPYLDMSELRKYSRSKQSKTGYNFSGMRRAHDALRKIRSSPIVVASNSATFHVKRVFTRLGLADLPISAYVTPERLGGVIKSSSSYWEPVFELFPLDQYQCTLLDDNEGNCILAQGLGMNALRLCSKLPFDDALMRFLLDPLNCASYNFRPDDEAYIAAKNTVDEKSFNNEVWERVTSHIDVKVKELFLTANNSMDAVTPEAFRVLDLGAGQLNMFWRILDVVRKSAGKEAPGTKVQYIALESNTNLWARIEKEVSASGLKKAPVPEGINSTSGILHFTGNVRGIEISLYLCADDFMSKSIPRTLKSLLNAGRNTSSPTVSDGQKQLSEKLNISQQVEGFHLIVGSCVADLHPPREFASQVTEMAADAGGLLYLPITFDGSTRLIVNQTIVESEWIFGMFGMHRHEIITAPVPARIDRDGDSEIDYNTLQKVFDQYHYHLTDQGHHLSAVALVTAFERSGSKLLVGDRSALPMSEWRISRREHPYMWNCMLYFILKGTVFELFDVLDMKKWVQELFLMPHDKEDPTFLVRNVDIVMELPKVEKFIHFAQTDGETQGQESNVGSQGYKLENMRATEMHRTPPLQVPVNKLKKTTDSSRLLLTDASQLSSSSVAFVGKGEIRIESEEMGELKDDQLLLRTVCTMVSTGTEIKLFRGDMTDTTENTPADLTIPGLSSYALKYPIRYGYSLVGEVIDVGSNLDRSEWLGRRVFSFSSHSTYAAVNSDSVHIIPDGIEYEDAVFLPAVETAVSLAMAAQPLIGEKVAVVGQGLIGLLTAAVLKTFMPLTDIYALDVKKERLAASASFTKGVHTINPSTASAKSSIVPFDVSIEVSGSIAGLQEAIDRTTVGGRVIIGSWYNPHDVGLSLGTRFHRSGIKLVTSQVSTIPANLHATWTKARRFEVAWRCIREMKPSRLLRLQSAEGVDNEVYLQDEVAVHRTFKRLAAGRAVTALLRGSADKGKSQ